MRQTEVIMEGSVLLKKAQTRVFLILRMRREVVVPIANLTTLRQRFRN